MPIGPASANHGSASTQHSTIADCSARPGLDRARMAGSQAVAIASDHPIRKIAGRKPSSAHNPTAATTGQGGASVSQMAGKPSP